MDLCGGRARVRTDECENALPGDRSQRSVVKFVITLALTTIIVAVATGLFALTAPSKYVSTTSLLVGPVSSDADTLKASTSLTSTYSQLLLRPQALAKVGQTVQMSAKQVNDDADVSFNVDTRIITLTVTTGSPATSRQIASSLTAQLTRLVGTVDPTAPGSLTILSVQPQTAVEVARSPIRYALLGGAAWLLVAVGVIAAFAARSNASERERTGTAPRPATTPTRAVLSRQDVESIAEQVKRKVLRSLDASDRERLGR